MNLEKTQSMQAMKSQITAERLAEIQKKNRLGVIFMSAGAVMFCLGAYVIVSTTLTLSALVVLFMALFLAMYGSHLYSGQYSKAAGEWALGIIKALRKSGDS